MKVEGVGDWLNVETDRAGRIPVNPDLTVPGLPEVSVIGDAAKLSWKDGLDVPGIAPAAKQEGKYVGRRIKGLIAEKPVLKPFKYKHIGSLATIGRNSAVIDFGFAKISGFVAWWLWGIIHIYFLIGVKRPFFVATSWFLNYVFHTKGARLITGMEQLRMRSFANRSGRSTDKKSV